VSHADADLRGLIVEIPDFPRPGILFRDLLPLLAHPDALHRVVEELATFAEPLRPDLILGLEARGFLFGPALAHRLGCGFVPARKAGKLPGEVHAAAYALEYGEDALELSRDAVPAGARVLLHDDLLATGGTAAAGLELARRAGGAPVGACFVAELRGLGGRAVLGELPTAALIAYDGA
jgi:adenine phosphoribosyltransferase